MPANVKAVPKGFHTVTPALCVRHADDAIEFYKKALGATELMRMETPDGRIMHAELQIGDSIIFLSDEFPEMGAAASPFDPPAETGPQASAERKPRATDYLPVDPFDPEIFNRQFFQDEK